MTNPLEVIDRTVSSYTGGLRTDEYYMKIYANEQGGVPTDTLVIEQGPPKSGAQTYTPTTPQQTQGGDVGRSESPIDAFLRTTAPHDAQVQPQNSVPVNTSTQTTQQYTQTVGTSPKPVDVSPVTAFSFVLNAAFSFAVVMSVIGLMFIVYVMMRTRQLHHHEHHVKELGGHGAVHTPSHIEAKHVDVTHDVVRADEVVVPEVLAEENYQSHHEAATLPPYIAEALSASEMMTTRGMRR
jgi:hypothetical protein